MSIADTVNTWFTERLANGPLARDTEAYNQAVSALPDLIERLTPTTDATAAADAETTQSDAGADVTGSTGKTSTKA